MSYGRSWERSLMIDAMGVKLFGWTSSWSDVFDKELEGFTKSLDSLAEDNYYSPDLSELYSHADHYVWLWGPYRKGHKRQLNNKEGDKAALLGHAVLPIIARITSGSIYPGRYLLTKGEESDNTLVSGEIWKVTPEVLTQLDFNLSNTVNCERELVQIRFAGKEYPCWVYFDKKVGLEINKELDKNLVSTYEMSLRSDPKRKFTVYYTKPGELS